jgi:hypothetical protein
LGDCIAFMLALPFDVNNSICPYPTRSNTTTCRTTHTFAAFNDPELHCPHVKPDSALCVNTCLPACANCHPNASCIATYPTLFEPVYECQCNNGFVGDGEYCTPLTCHKGKCPADKDTFSCENDNLCMCTETFVHDPSSLKNYCTCPSPSRVFHNSLSEPICVPQGRCIEGQHWQCDIQEYSQVKCLPYGNNTFTLYDHCRCNYGFDAGWEYPCVCDAPKRILWSSDFAGDICLTPSECQFTWQCASGQTCHRSSGQLIGNCA